MFQTWFNIASVLFLLVLGYVVGRARERRHFRSLAIREGQYADITITNLKQVHDVGAVCRSGLVMGEAVIATDYFKSFAAKLRNIVGGEMRTFETLMVRARREASLRMLAQARALGAVEVCNVRYETSNIRSGSGRRNPGVSVEVFAFGTAVVRE
ncbi:MAG: YbjQ family protein [bacterium]|nr:YbjQ family protein [bacterium]